MDEITFRESRRAGRVQADTNTQCSYTFQGDEVVAGSVGNRPSNAERTQRRNNYSSHLITPPSQLQDLLVGLAGVGAMLCICWLLIAMLFHDTCNGRGC